MDSIISFLTTHQQLLLTFSVAYGFILVSVICIWLVSIPIKNVSIIDIFWGAGFGFVAIISYVLQPVTNSHQFILALLPTLWAIRCAVYIFLRNIGHGEDPRYTKMRSWVKPGQSFNVFSLRMVFLAQGNIMWLVSLPIMVGMSLEPVDVGLLTWLGGLLWAIGFLCEAIADWQLSHFKKDPENKGKILDTGLWHYSRHPNYFGNATLWWGIFLVACENPWCLITVIGPIFMTHILLNVTGKKNLEKKMLKEKPEYARYVASTSGFILWFRK